jgi:MiaB/RimO family radical SAM methylthiotransferase
VTLGCARNEVDSEELAGRLAAGRLDPGRGRQRCRGRRGEHLRLRRCGQEGLDRHRPAGGRPQGQRADQAVVAVGCLAERYGEQLAASLPEADAVLGFDDYADISARLGRILAGEAHVPHVPSDRRHLLPLAPVDRQAEGRAVPGHGAVDRPDLPDGVAPASGPRSLRMRLGSGPVAPLKLASGCDRRCTFCAIPSFRGSFVSRRPGDVLAEARWLAEQGVREVVLVSENSTSYGKDLGDLRLLETLLPEIAAVDGLDRVRVSYLQPAEMRPVAGRGDDHDRGRRALLRPLVQHASGPVLRRMRRFGDADRFLELVGQVRAAAPDAGVRSNVIVGFPGETEADLAELERFLVGARMDAVGVFGYSDEDGTEAATLDGKHQEAVIRERTERVSALADELVAQRAEDRLGETVHVLVESVTGPDSELGEGRAAHQAPEVDGSTTLRGAGLEVGRIVAAKVVATDGVDLVAEVLG